MLRRWLVLWKEILKNNIGKSYKCHDGISQMLPGPWLKERREWLTQLVNVHVNWLEKSRDQTGERCGPWASLIFRINCDVFVACTEELIPEFDFVIQAFMF
jgi:hypothetical protein